MSAVLLLRVAHEGGGGVVELDDVLAPVLAHHQLQRAHLQTAEDFAHLKSVDMRPVPLGGDNVCNVELKIFVARCVIV